MSERWKVVIIGGGGWWAFCGPAPELKSGGRDAYRSAELSPFPTAALSGRDGLALGWRDRLAPSEVLSQQKSTRVWLGTVVDIDPDSKRVFLEDGAIVPYDSLIVATGSQTSYFGTTNGRSGRPA